MATVAMIRIEGPVVVLPLEDEDCGDGQRMAHICLYTERALRAGEGSLFTAVDSAADKRIAMQVSVSIKRA